MMNLNKFIGAGVALVGSTVVLGSTLSAAPAQAYNIVPGSKIVINGPASLVAGGIKFTSPSGNNSLNNNTVLSTTNDFASAGNYPIATGTNSKVKVGTGQNFVLSNGFLGTLFTFLGSTPGPELKFSITSPLNINTSFAPTLAFTNQFAGTFLGGGGTAVGKGILIFQNVGGPSDGGYSASITVVPEPFTILGTATALGFGAFLKNKKKKEENQISA
jgi:hypothetical protein